MGINELCRRVNEWKNYPTDLLASKSTPQRITNVSGEIHKVLGTLLKYGIHGQAMRVVMISLEVISRCIEGKEGRFHSFYLVYLSLL